MKMHHKDIDTDGVTEEGGEGHDDSQEREEEEHADNQKSEEEGYDDSKESEGEEHADSQESEKEGHDDIQESEEEESRLNTSDEESTMVNLNESDILRYSIEPESIVTTYQYNYFKNLNVGWKTHLLFTNSFFSSSFENISCITLKLPESPIYRDLIALVRILTRRIWAMIFDIAGTNHR